MTRDDAQLIVGNELIVQKVWAMRRNNHLALEGGIPEYLHK